MLAPRLVPESRDPSPGPLDPFSVLLSLTAMLPLVWAIKTGAHDGLSWVIAAALAVSVGSGVLFVRRQNRSATPMLDIKLFGYAPFWTSILANFLSIVGLIGFIFFISQHLQLVLGLSPLAAGLVTLPGAVLSMVAGIGVVRLVRWFKPHTLIVVGLVLVSAGFGMILLFRHDLTVVAVVVSFIVLELGVGMSQTITNDTIVASVPACEGWCGVRRLGDGLRTRRRRRDGDSRHHLHGVLPCERRSSARSFADGDGRRRGEHRWRRCGGPHPARRRRRAPARLGTNSVRLGYRANRDHRRAVDPDRGRGRRHRAPGRQRSRRPISISAAPTSAVAVRTWFHAVHVER